MSVAVMRTFVNTQGVQDRCSEAHRGELASGDYTSVTVTLLDCMRYVVMMLIYDLVYDFNLR